MRKNYSITDYFGRNLAEFLSEKIEKTYSDFNSKEFIRNVDKVVKGKTYTQRISVIAETLQIYLPKDYPLALSILISILGDENPNQTGMFKKYYWIIPIGKFISLYGLEDLN